MLFEIEKITMYQQDARGAMRVWSIWQDGNEIVWQYGLENGAKQTRSETVHKGKAGRTLQQQIELQINSKIQTQKLKGYKFSREEALAGKTNALGLVPPMLALPINKVKHLSFKEAFVQPKFDGNRCIITYQNKEFIAYSRKGKIIQADLSHIYEGLNLEEGQSIDGELYCHGESLQTIVSWVKRNQPSTKKVKFHAYDVLENLPYMERFEILKSSIAEGASTVEIAQTQKISSLGEAFEYQKEKIEEGYEGAILRWGDFPNEVGKRSKSLVKIKSWQSGEFLVVDIEPSKDGWAVLVCRTPWGNQFKVSAPGSFEERRYIYENKVVYIGKFVTVEFAYLTADKIPFHPVAIAWRDYE